MAYNNLTPVVRPFLLVHLAFDEEPLFVNTTPNTIAWDGEEWVGTGVLGAITPTDQNIDMTASSISLTLSGVPLPNLNSARAEKYRGREAFVYLGYFGENWEIDGDPLMSFRGEMDTMSINSSGETASITVTVKNALVEWERPSIHRYTHETQIERFPDDLGFEFLPVLKEITLPWGVSPS